MAASTTDASVSATLPGAKGEQFETRQTGTDTNSWVPDPSKSLKLDGPRQSLVDDIVDLYSGKPTVEKIKRYTPDSVYDDPFSYANDRYQIACQWIALPKIFECVHNGHEVVKIDPELIQFKNSMTWTPRILPKAIGGITLNSLVSLSLDPATVNSDFIKVKYHKDQADEKDYSHTGIKHKLKEWQAKGTAKMMSDEMLKPFEQDFKGANRDQVNVYKE